jgi:hypothetical protein
VTTESTEEGEVLAQAGARVPGIRPAAGEDGERLVGGVEPGLEEASGLEPRTAGEPGGDGAAGARAGTVLVAELTPQGRRVEVLALALVERGGVGEEATLTQAVSGLEGLAEVVEVDGGRLLVMAALAEDAGRGAEVAEELGVDEGGAAVAAEDELAGGELAVAAGEEMVDLRRHRPGRRAVATVEEAEAPLGIPVGEAGGCTGVVTAVEVGEGQRVPERGVGIAFEEVEEAVELTLAVVVELVRGGCRAAVRPEIDPIHPGRCGSTLGCPVGEPGDRARDRSERALRSGRRRVGGRVGQGIGADRLALAGEDLAQVEPLMARDLLEARQGRIAGDRAAPVGVMAVADGGEVVRAQEVVRLVDDHAEPGVEDGEVTRDELVELSVAQRWVELGVGWQPDPAGADAVGDPGRRMRGLDARCERDQHTGGRRVAGGPG